MCDCTGPVTFLWSVFWLQGSRRGVVVPGRVSGSRFVGAASAIHEGTENVIEIGKWGYQICMSCSLVFFPAS